MSYKHNAEKSWQRDMDCIVWKYGEVQIFGNNKSNLHACRN